MRTRLNVKIKAMSLTASHTAQNVAFKLAHFALLYTFLLVLSGLVSAGDDIEFIQSENLNEISWHFPNDESKKGTLVKYGTYKPRQSLEQFKDFGDGITIWVDEQDFISDPEDVHQQVALVRENMEIMVTHSSLTQELLFDLSLKKPLNTAGVEAGFSVGIIVSNNPALVLERSAGYANPVIPDDNLDQILREKIARNSKPSRDVVPVVIRLDQSLFESINGHQGLPLPNLVPVTGTHSSPTNLPTFEELTTEYYPSDEILSQSDSSRLVYSPDGEDVALVIFDSTDQHVKTVELYDLDLSFESDWSRIVSFHEFGHARSLIAGRVAPLVDDTISKYKVILEGDLSITELFFCALRLDPTFWGLNSFCSEKSAAMLLL